MDIWDFSSKLTQRLLVWSVFSVVISAVTVFSSNPFLRGLGIQFFVWGVIDGAIAIFGKHASAKRKLEVEISDLVESEAKESRWLERILWINTCLDVFYILGGIWLIQTWGAKSLLWEGHGIGIIIQGGFLFFFDFFHAVTLRNRRVI
jgi:hypothetical protein